MSTPTDDTTDEQTITTLPDIDLPPVVDTARHDLKHEFYEPCLSVAVEYRRGVGYFSTQWFRKAATGVSLLVANGGTARWIISPVLSEADAQTLVDGFDARANRSTTLMEIVGPQLDDLASELEVNTRNAIGWLIAEGYIDIKVAIPTTFDGAMFHDKFGVIKDGAGNRLSFHGSKNDSQQGFRNHEAFTIDRDWVGESDWETVEDHERRFDRLWDGVVDGVDTIPLPEAARDGLLDLRTTDIPPYHPPAGDGGVGITGPQDDDDDGDDGPLRDTVTLRPYQQDAIEAWVQNDYRGTFEIATGLGKTITAMAGIDAFVESVDTDVLVVVAVPETYLGRQWADELVNWGFDEPLMAYGSENSQWLTDLSDLVTDIELGMLSPGIAITTHASFHKESFRNHIDRAQVPCMLIADEVHGVGTETRQQGLDSAYAARLGLSATPQRYMDSEGTDALDEYFGGTVFEYGLAEGIPEYLSRYEYHPQVVELTEEEAGEYISESQRLAATIGSEEASDDAIQQISRERADIGKTAQGKLAALRRTLRELPSHRDLLVFCHHGQMDAVIEELYRHDVKYHQYTQEESTAKRERLLESFAQDEGGLDALVGIHCLDEGVDVSTAETAIVMSSTGNPRQFVQRRGRVLRQDEDKEVARIYDFIVVPPRTHFDDLLDSERHLIRSQLARHREFARTAVNRTEAEQIVRELQEALDDK
ncbi:DEAD/DEAH box helicase family protein [Salinigranum halophilum]|uniref:DEAD/DEAH box helicase family protein n=1 Tax=Salinigranum halophilum TaxID=2565931 RepID=UPI0010A94998|nr:DEAD/DEAH box helicase family protein [Salinigranum halophilum]